MVVVMLEYQKRPPPPVPILAVQICWGGATGPDRRGQLSGFEFVEMNGVRTVGVMPL